MKQTQLDALTMEEIAAQIGELSGHTSYGSQVAVHVLTAEQARRVRSEQEEMRLAMRDATTDEDLRDFAARYPTLESSKHVEEIIEARRLGREPAEALK